ncbi:MAG: hypothetical protein RI964_2342 [Pseudomonadota bacterium]|jgi:plasmid stability protein
MQTKPVIRVQTRYQPDIHQWLINRAGQHNRSMNGELMEILKEVKEGTAEKAAYERGRLAGIEQAMNP